MKTRAPDLSSKISHPALHKSKASDKLKLWDKIIIYDCITLLIPKLTDFSIAFLPARALASSHFSLFVESREMKWNEREMKSLA